ncbi:hypothetical protein [Erwinia sp. HR93]|uniref:hypothetical protein n=1 Tax=Erwinia sp. HR93 TaxID=3094840 RepID=UPI002ADEC94A|nr:hypothetical protein [Erwinia sp. HR93]MEA1063795.1 hypothetical protein [Erwinia sp. HR93]
MGLQTQRHLERFLTLARVPAMTVTSPLSIAFSDHQLHITLFLQRLCVTITAPVQPDEEQMLALFQRADPERLNGVLVRPCRLTRGVAVSASVADDASAERLLMTYRALLRLLTPWIKIAYR